jgi:hypothetical protein
MNRWVLTLLALLVTGSDAVAQGWRVRLDLRGQATSFRGWRIDSLPVADTVSGGTGGPETPDGYVARCDGGAFCRYWRPGAEVRGIPTVLTTEAALFGLGVEGLSFHLLARNGTDLAGGSPWYGPDRGIELLEGYADLQRERTQLRVGRQVTSSRLGWWGFDGGRGWVRDTERGLEASIYGGWGLARSSNLTAVSDALNPLGDFQTAERQWALGGTARWSRPRGSVQLGYHREVSGVDGGITVERGAVEFEGVATRHLTATGGGVYDLAAGLWGSWDVGLAATVDRWHASARVRQYRPLFDLWSVWQAFSPSAYRAIEGGLGVRLAPAVALRVSGAKYEFEESATSTPLVTIEDGGWRNGLGVTWTPNAKWTVDAEAERGFGVGASQSSIEGTATWRPTPKWSARVSAGRLERPLEYRYDVATLRWVGVGADWRPDPRLTASVGLDQWNEARDRPDAAAFDWGQTRLLVRLSWLLSSDADQQPLPRGRPRGAP